MWAPEMHPFKRGAICKAQNQLVLRAKSVRFGPVPGKDLAARAETEKVPVREHDALSVRLTLSALAPIVSSRWRACSSGLRETARAHPRYRSGLRPVSA